MAHLESNSDDEAVALDAEIDKFLEEKADKNNLTATNVKNIIRQVITNDYVQKMVLKSIKKKKKSKGKNDHSSDDEPMMFEPKLTRAKIKELSTNSTTSSNYWPSMSNSPVKIPPIMRPTSPSETQILINQVFPIEDSSDEEFVPTEKDILHESDDETSSVASQVSDVGSPATPRPIRKRRIDQLQSSPLKEFNIPIFKTPPPRFLGEAQPVSAIGQRTRSKQPLKETSLETLEMQFIPPDITTDMYDWATEADDKDYLDFLQEFLFPNQKGHENNDDEETDPEYNAMEDEEVHDKEELRMDRAVKVSKKELNDMVAGLFEEFNLSSSDELDFTTNGNVTSDKNKFSTSSNSRSLMNTPEPIIEMVKPIEPFKSPKYREKINEEKAIQVNNNAITIQISETIDSLPNPTKEPEILFTNENLERLHFQMKQHVQLLAQSYVLTASFTEKKFTKMTVATKELICHIKDMSDIHGPYSAYSVCNLDHAWKLVTTWPTKRTINNKSPIKKRILEETLINNSVVPDEMRGRNFPQPIAKVMAESSAFMFSFLLPNYYYQDVNAPSYFSHSEDALIAHGLIDLGESFPSLTMHSKSELIQKYLLTSRDSCKIFNRIRNCKKATYKTDGSPLQAYLLKETIPSLPKSQIHIDRSNIPVSPIDIPEELHSMYWRKIISDLEKPINSSKLAKSRKKLNFEQPSKKKVKEKKPPKRTRKQDEAILNTFQNGFTEKPFEKMYPDHRTISILDDNGEPNSGFVIVVPNYAYELPTTSSEMNSSPEEITEIIERETPTVNIEPSPIKSHEVKLTDNENVSSLDFKSPSTQQNSSKSSLDLSETTSKSEDEEDDEIIEVLNPDFPMNEAGGSSETQQKSKGSEKEKIKEENTNTTSCNTKGKSSTGESSSGGCASGDGDEGGDDNPEKWRNDKKLPDDKNDFEGPIKKEPSEGEDSYIPFMGAAGIIPKRKINNSPPKIKIGSPNSRVLKKFKKSPTSHSKKRTSRYNLTPVEKLVAETQDQVLEEAEDAVITAYTSSFLNRVQSRLEIETKNPQSFSTFVDLLIELGESRNAHRDKINEKIKELLKGHPDLIREFRLISKDNKKTEGEDGSYNLELDEERALIEFIVLLEKWTVKCPKLRNKILHKIRLLLGETEITKKEEEIIFEMEPLLEENPLLMSYFRAMFPSIFRPQSSFDQMDFEHINLESEESEKPNEDQFEVIKLPEETCVISTFTCPCTCHINTTDQRFLNRAKHCAKCCVKFHEGKVYTHTGRISKQMLVELKPRKEKDGPLAKDKETPSVQTEQPSTSQSQGSGSGGWSQQEDLIIMKTLKEQQYSGLNSLVTILNRPREEVEGRFMELISAWQAKAKGGTPKV